MEFPTMKSDGINSVRNEVAWSSDEEDDTVPILEGESIKSSSDDDSDDDSLENPTAHVAKKTKTGDDDCRQRRLDSRSRDTEERTACEDVTNRKSLVSGKAADVSKEVLRADRDICSGKKRICKEIVGGIRMREATDLPDQATWPHRPALLVVNTPVSPLLKVPRHGTGPCPIGVPFEFSSELFEGKCLVRLRDIPSDDPVSNTEYFSGRRRRFQAIVQGRFKEELAVSNVLTGHEFVRSLQRLPPSWMLRTGTSLIRRLAPGVQIDLHGDSPRASSILAATSQAVSANMPGKEPDITDIHIPEDTSLLGGIFAEGNTSSSTRKRALSNPERAKQYKFDTKTVYTFDFYQNILDVATYSLDLGFTKLGICKCLDGQPIQVMSKTADGRYLWSFQLWHEELLRGDER